MKTETKTIVVAAALVIGSIRTAIDSGDEEEILNAVESSQVVFRRALSERAEPTYCASETVAALNFG